MQFLGNYSHSSRCNEQHLKVFEMQGLQWKKLCGACTDEALAMLGCKSGFQMKVKARKWDGMDVGTGGEQEKALVPLKSEFLFKYSFL